MSVIKPESQKPGDGPKLSAPQAPSKAQTPVQIQGPGTLGNSIGKLAKKIASVRLSPSLLTDTLGIINAGKSTKGEGESDYKIASSNAAGCKSELATAQQEYDTAEQNVMGALFDFGDTKTVYGNFDNDPEFETKQVPDFDAREEYNTWDQKSDEAWQTVMQEEEHIAEAEGDMNDAQGLIASGGRQITAGERARTVAQAQLNESQRGENS